MQAVKDGRGTKHKQSRSRAGSVVGFAWYRREQWQRLRQVSADVEELEESYHEWLATASTRFRQLQELGFNIRRADVDVEDLVEWCKQQGRPVDGAARADYVAEGLRRHP